MSNPFEIPVGDEQLPPPGKFEIGDTVLVADPGPNDMWNHSFVGSVVDTGEGVVSVIDDDENIFDIDESQARLYNEDEDVEEED